MAFGIPPKHFQELPLGKLTHEQFLVLSYEVALKLGWKISSVSKSGFTACARFSMSSRSEEINLKIIGLQAVLQSRCNGNQILDWGKNEKNVDSFVTNLRHLKGSMSMIEMEEKYNALSPIMMDEEEAPQNEEYHPVQSKVSGFFSIFIPAKGYFVTPIILYLNLIVFILMIIAGVDAFMPDNESLIQWGANFRPVTLDGEPWRLISSCFLHIGIFHLLMNMYALIFIGLLLEPYLGKIRFIAAYLLTGLASSLASLWWNDLTISAGASGAIFGLYGIFLAMLTTNLIDKNARRSLLTSIGIFVFYNLLNGMKPGIDNAAHIGGLATGLAMGYAWYPGLKKPEIFNLNHPVTAILAITIVSASFLVVKTIPNDIKAYDAGIQKFGRYESMALEVLNRPEDTPKALLLNEIETRGIYYWNMNIGLLMELNKLNLPDELYSRNKKMIRYCQLRIKSYQLLYRTIDEDTDIYRFQIEDHVRQIDAIVAELTNVPQ